MAACGAHHTIMLSNDGTLHSFGKNYEGQLGLGHNNNVTLPRPIPNLSKITLIACGYSFTVCVDYEGSMWSFGENNSGQLGTGNTTLFNVPQKILSIPPVLSIACGFSHTLIITTCDNLWSCGNNNYGQLCLRNLLNETKLWQTSFSNISTISTGFFHSLFQNDKGEIFVHVVIIIKDNVDWVILIILKSFQLSFSMYLQILLNLFVSQKCQKIN